MSHKKDIVVMTSMVAGVALLALMFFLNLSRNTFQENVVLNRLSAIDARILDIQRNRFTDEDQSLFVTQLNARFEINEARIIRIFSRLRLIEHDIKLKPEGQDSE